MHIYTVVAFAILFWNAEEAPPWVLVGDDDVAWTLIATLLQPLAVGLASYVVSRRTLRRLRVGPEAAGPAQHFFHRGTFVLRMICLLGFTGLVFFTRWTEWFQLRQVSPALQIFGDWLILSPFFAGTLAMWLAAYPVERKLRSWDLVRAIGEGSVRQPRFRLRAYLDFNVRHHLLVVAVPMSMILFAANLLRAYERPLHVWTGSMWTADVLLGGVAFGVFVVSPLILRRIWRTRPLTPGSLRERLESLCEKIGLRVRDILVWDSDGMMINAAVMGVVPSLRYVLLSDGLLATMDVRQVEAVFGHEAGHVRRHHIPHFLVFTFVGWLIVAGLMELLAVFALGAGSAVALSALTIQGVGVAVTLLVWLVGFGWLSRRFEREADLFGARCVTPNPSDCLLPCSVHADAPIHAGESGRVCATGTAIFASALDRVALLNGIPHDERSWRHSSIGSRIRFLSRLAGDPTSVARFERVVRRVKVVMLALAVLGSAATAYYCIVVPRPAILRLQDDRDRRWARNELS